MKPDQAIADIRALLRLPYGTPPGEVVDRLYEDVARLRAWSCSRDALVCPRCGCHAKWGCASGVGRTGFAHCQDGANVWPRIPGLGEPCDWPGARIVRLEGGEVGWHPDNPGGEVAGG